MNFNKVKPSTALAFVFLSACSILLAINSNLMLFSISNDAYSLIFISLVFLIAWIFTSEKIKLTSAMFIFNCTVFIFLGGRFISHFVLGDQWEIFDLNFMTKFKSSDIDSCRIFSIVFSFIVFSNMFYFFSFTKKLNMDSVKNNNKALIVTVLVITTLLFLYLLKEQFSLYLLTKDSGYLSRYSEHQSTEYRSGDTLITTIFYVFIGFCFYSKQSTLQKTSCVYLVLLGLLSALGGQRGPFIVSILFIIWFVGLTRDIGIRKLVVFTIVTSVVLTLIMSLTARGDRYSELGIINGIAVFLYHQGITLSVVNYAISELFDKYPIYPYITSFIPGGARVSSYINGGPLMPYELGFGAYTAHAANALEYASGRGTGWSIVGNLYLFSGGIMPVFFIMSGALGAIIRIIEDSARGSKFYLGLLACILPQFFFVARAEFKTVFTTAIIYIFIFCAASIAMRIMQKKQPI